jgi:geranylgeranyl pyrophosphate synthase
VTTASPDPQALRTWLDARRVAVDAALESYLPAPPRAPASVCDAMRYSVMAGGKRLRPMLVLASAEAIAESGRAGTLTREEAAALAMPAACAVEMIHTYSLVHDDLPAMDDDTLRRGRPTAHVVFGEGLAILSGDGLLTEAFALLAREPAGTAPAVAADLAARRLETVLVLADAAGAAGMVGGQAIDLQAAAGATALDGDALRRMHARKTGALIRGSAAAGAIMAGASRADRAAIDAYADALGLAFQIVDDILDVEGASADLGKTAGKDAAAGKPTYPALFGLDESRRLAQDCASRARAALADAGLAGQLPAIIQWVIARTN